MYWCSRMGHQCHGQRPHPQETLAPGAGDSWGLPAPLQEQHGLLQVGRVHVEDFIPPSLCLRPLSPCCCRMQYREAVRTSCLPASSKPRASGGSFLTMK